MSTVTFTRAELQQLRIDPIIINQLVKHHEQQALVSLRKNLRQSAKFHTSRANALRKVVGELVC